MTAFLASSAVLTPAIIGLLKTLNRDVAMPKAFSTTLRALNMR